VVPLGRLEASVTALANRVELLEATVLRLTNWARSVRDQVL
jgi:hypothetical protein